MTQTTGKRTVSQSHTLNICVGIYGIYVYTNMLGNGNRSDSSNSVCNANTHTHKLPLTVVATQTISFRKISSQDWFLFRFHYGCLAYVYFLTTFPTFFLSSQRIYTVVVIFWEANGDRIKGHHHLLHHHHTVE